MSLRSRSISVDLSIESPHERSNSENFDFPAKTAVGPPAPWTTSKTDETPCPAASCTVAGWRRSSFQMTPWPPRSATILRPVTMPVWFGRVSVRSRSVRAFIVDAPRRTSRCSVGVPRLPSLRIAAGLSASIETTTTLVTARGALATWLARWTARGACWAGVVAPHPLAARATTSTLARA